MDNIYAATHGGSTPFPSECFEVNITCIDPPATPTNVVSEPLTPPYVDLEHPSYESAQEPENFPAESIPFDNASPIIEVPAENGNIPTESIPSESAPVVPEPFTVSIPSEYAPSMIDLPEMSNPPVGSSSVIVPRFGTLIIATFGVIVAAIK